MLRLLILRHAKSDWPPGADDRMRPLAPRGIAAAPRMGAYLADEAIVPDLALVSPARRTVETWQLVAPAFPSPPPHRLEPAMYDAPAERLLTLVRAVPASVRTLLLVGHNPGSQDLALELTGDGDPTAAARMAAKFPTAALAVLDFDLPSWEGVAARSGRLDRFATPASIGHGPDE